MKRIFFIILFLLLPNKSQADFWGGDLPLLAQIVTNTLKTLSELKKQSSLLEFEMAGIQNRIDRIRTISAVVHPSSWDKWKNPAEALMRLQKIYQTLPLEYRSEKSDLIEQELARAMNLISRIRPEAIMTFRSGKEMERKGADASPGVATKLTASGIGTLISMEAQSQVIQSHVTSLLAQMLADANEKESRMVITRGKTLSGVSESLGGDDSSFSRQVLKLRKGE